MISLLTLTLLWAVEGPPSASSSANWVSQGQEQALGENIDEADLLSADDDNLHEIVVLGENDGVDHVKVGRLQSTLTGFVGFRQFLPDGRALAPHGRTTSENNVGQYQCPHCAKICKRQNALTSHTRN